MQLFQLHNQKLQLRCSSSLIAQIPEGLFMLKTAASSVAEATPSAAPASVARAIESSCPSRGVVWIDLDNSPHVPFFVPIIHQLEARGYSVLLTARDCFQVAELAKLHNLKIGRASCRE